MIHFGYFSSSTIHLEFKRQIRLYAPVVPLKTIPDLRHNGQNLYPFSDQNGSKIIPFGAAHTYIAYIGEIGEIGEYPPPSPPDWPGPVYRKSCDEL